MATSLLNENEKVIKIVNKSELNKHKNDYRKNSTSDFLSKRSIALNLEPLDVSGKHIEINFTNDHDPATSINLKHVKSLDIGFKNLSFTAKGIFRREKRYILRHINGEFKSGELTSVMGPSGAGKSTLMNIISGYTTKNVLGEITINGHARNPKRFRRQAAYIMQDHNLHPLLTVIEAMRFSAHLKLGNYLTQEEKNIIITRILDSISLSGSFETRTGNLSGGQAKRLAIALELVNNPPVMLFDEPTSGLDSSMSNQIMSLLKKLALEGRTIICTIHQPSALVFEMFDHLYAIAGGECIYTGTTKNLVPFLRELNLECPKFHNPSDYLLEISTNDYGPQNPELVKKTRNGENTDYRKRKAEQETSQIHAMLRVEKMMEAGLMTPVNAPNISPNSIPSLAPVTEQPVPNNLTVDTKMKKTKKAKKLGIKLDECCRRDDRYSASLLQQFCILSRRTFLILKRDHSLTSTRVGIHVIVSLLIGMMYFNIGNEAHHMKDNFGYIMFSIMFLMFTAFSSMTMTFPLELPIIAREHFNRWYSLKAYYTAMTLADVPIQLGCTLIYISITYFMTHQPLDPFRFTLFFVMCLMVTLVAQSIGLLAGSLFSVTHAAIFGPFLILPFLIFSGFFITMKDAHPFWHWIFHISFLKYALEGSALAILGYDRSKMDCSAIYCHYSIPKKFLNEFSMDNGSYVTCFVALVIIFFFLRILCYFIVLYKLRHKR